MDIPSCKVGVTPYGQVTISPYGSAFVSATQDELRAWARRPYAVWPCSTLAQCASVSAYFDGEGNLVAIEHPYRSDVDGHEFDAWSSDLLRLAGFEDCPAIRS